MAPLGTGIFSTVYLRNLLAQNPTTQVFPIQYQQPNGTWTHFAMRTDLQAELDSRAPVQDRIWGLAWLPENPT